MISYLLQAPQQGGGMDPQQIMQAVAQKLQQGEQPQQGRRCFAQRLQEVPRQRDQVHPDLGQDHRRDRVTFLLGVESRIVSLLRGPEDLEFVLDHRSIDVQVI